MSSPARPEEGRRQRGGARGRAGRAGGETLGPRRTRSRGGTKGASRQAAAVSRESPSPAGGAAGRELRRGEGLAPCGEGSLAAGDFETARRSLERRIRAHLSRGALEVTLTDNRHTMISVRRETSSGPRYRVRLHHMFADAGPSITRALARYIARNDADASRLLGEFIDENQHRVKAKTRPRTGRTLVTRGEFHDLQEIFDSLNARYFQGRIDARITWGRKNGKPKKRNSIKMGSYSVEERLIRIHRSLDREFVPRFFVEWIVYHEMLHQVHDVAVENGRRKFHTKAFMEDEARFEHYALARAWERAHLDELLTY